MLHALSSEVDATVRWRLAEARMTKAFRLPKAAMRCGLLLLLALSLAGVARAARAQTAPTPAATPDGPRNTDEFTSAMVIVDGYALFPVRGVGSITADERAQNIGNRISAAAADRSLSAESLHIEPTDLGSQVVIEDRPLVVAVEADARASRITSRQLAESHLTSIRTAIDRYRRERTTDSLFRASLAALAATAALVLVVGVLITLRRRLERWLKEHFQQKLSTLQGEKVVLSRTDKMWAAFSNLLGLIGWLAALVVAIAYAQYTLGLFPWTRGLAVGLLGYLAVPLQTLSRGAVKLVPSLIFLAVLTLATRLVLRGLAFVAELIDREIIRIRNFEPDWAWPTYRIVRAVVLIFAVVVAYPTIPGSNTEAFKGISIFVGVLISLGSTSVVGNLLSGYTMIYRRAFRVGDRVQIEDMIGEVTDIRVMVTHLRTPKNEEIVIPNSVIVNNKVVNFSALSRKRGLILHTIVGIGYEVPWRQVQAMLLTAADKTAAVLKDPKPFVLQRSLDDFAVKYELNAYIDEPARMLAAYDELHRNVLDQFNEYGVQIMTPAYEGDPESPKVVPRSKWHAAPAPPPAEPAPSS
jgi:small-conductance mechanosensitive channel